MPTTPTEHTGSRVSTYNSAFKVMSYAFWFNIDWFEPAELDVYGNYYAILWSSDGCRVDDSKEVIAGPAPAPVQGPCSEDECPF